MLLVVEVLVGGVLNIFVPRGFHLSFLIQGETVSVDREPLAELFDADSSIVCVSAISVQHLEPNGGIVIAAGCADGSFCVWNLHGDGGKLRCSS